jgi:2-methylcitrate dehydratase
VTAQQHRRNGAEHYEDAVAGDPRIDRLRQKMVVKEDARYTREYLDPGKRSIANAVQVFFRDRTRTEKVEVEYPIGHRRRRREGIPVLEKKFYDALRTRFPKGQAEPIYELCLDAERLAATPVHRFMDLFVI